MQNYYRFEFPQPSGPRQEELLAELIEWPFEGFEERNDCLLAFIPESEVNTELKEFVNEICRLYNWSTVKKEIIEPKNWNEDWENKYEAVIVGNFCAIRANFHLLEADVKHEIIITPKMSFGTGHHETTHMMVQAMEKIDFVKKNVLDFGCGTSVLAILATKLGAEHCDAVDIDEWAYENSIENVTINNVQNRIDIFLGDWEVVPSVKYDIILANINRHIILRSLTDMANKIISGGSILCSGFLDSDIELIRTESEIAGLTLKEEYSIDRWRCLHFSKN
jgi:ribosomal protein L11 methyltransferase